VTLGGPFDPRALEVPCAECHADVGHECVNAFMEVQDRFHGARLVLWYEHQRLYDRALVEKRVNEDAVVQSLRRQYVAAVQRMSRTDPDLATLLEGTSTIGTMLLRRVRELGYRDDPSRAVPKYKIVPAEHD
jgi:hypothetical protein